MTGRALRAGLVAALVAASACDDTLPTDSACREVPDGGCPMGRGDPCADPACAAAYACTESSRWRFDHACPARDAAGDADDAGTADGGGNGAGDAGARDVVNDVPGANGGPGCAELQAPDCPLGIALACADGCCGCEDLFVCRSGSWEPWGTCGDGGGPSP